MRKPKIVLSTLSHMEPDGSRNTIKQEILATFNEMGMAQLTCQLLKEYVYSDLLSVGRKSGTLETDPNSSLYTLTVER